MTRPLPKLVYSYIKAHVASYNLFSYVAIADCSIGIRAWPDALMHLYKRRRTVASRIYGVAYVVTSGRRKAVLLGFLTAALILEGLDSVQLRHSCRERTNNCICM